MNRRNFLSLLTGSGAIVAAGAYPVFVEPYFLTVNKYRILLPRLPVTFDGFTIVQITDLHYGFLVPLSFIRQVVNRVNSIPRDLVVCTGDYVHERDDTKALDAVWGELGRLKSPNGVLSVLGNHDHWADPDRSIFWLNRTNQNLRHKQRCFSKGNDNLWFVGAGDYWEDNIGLDFLMRGIPSTDCRIILAHNPDTADGLFDTDVDLFISGHTHGGQVKIPLYGTPVLPVKNKAYSSGVKRSLRNTPVYISRGIGWAVYPVRFNCPPEISIIELKSDKREL